MSWIEVLAIPIVLLGGLLIWFNRTPPKKTRRGGENEQRISPENEVVYTNSIYSTSSHPHRVHNARTPTKNESDAIYNQSDLLTLLSLAKRYINKYPKGRTRQIGYFYRDKSEIYYDDIMSSGGIMEVYRKDFHGDPKSPINGRLDGLFFSVNVDFRTNNPVPFSVYGKRRLLIKPEILQVKCTNLYFVDFYCVHAPHYVTLVMTKSGSYADDFCRDYLISIDWENNPFLTRNNYGGFSVTTSGVWIEVFFTENINIRNMLLRGARWEDVEMRGYRTGGRIGLRKNSTCEVCNI